jgi:uncharacterized protein (TIGR02145 family)
MKTTRLLFYFLFASALMLTSCNEDQDDPTTCSDGIQNGTETGVDCGGATCPSCPITPTCSDGIQNGTETGVDCGGVACPACPITPTCSDGIQNGTETGIDCGGATCPACPITPTCSDGIQNGTETGIDCGGVTCPVCNDCPATVTDINGNVYNVVSIGTQCWMKENLKTSKYNDGTSIPTGLNGDTWQTTTSGAYAIYENNAANNTTYGKLYNWYAVNTGKLCPAGWHIPTDAEWTILTDFLGGETLAGGKMKSTSPLWELPNTGATNESGFSGLPGGLRSLNFGNYYDIGDYGNWWSSTEDDVTNAWNRDTYYDSSIAGRDDSYKWNGFSCRCIKD